MRRLRTSLRGRPGGVAVMFLAIALSPIPASAASAAANIDQCTNGAVGPPISREPCLVGSVANTSGVLKKYANWVNGNSNGNQSHWTEGDFISYRVTVTGLTAASHTIVFHYDTIHGSKHAIDYVGSFDATETTSPTATTFHRNANNPCADLLPSSQCWAPGAAPPGPPTAPTSTFAVPPASLINCGGSAGTTPSQAAGRFQSFGPTGTTITGASYLAQNAPSGSGQCSTAMSLTFTEPTANAP